MQCPVSVIIPCYRSAETIKRAVASVINQTLPPQEILLVEDCSGDDGRTLAALFHIQQSFQKLVAIKVIPLRENTGPGGARNAGWSEARQPYLAFLDADDSWHPEKLEIQYRWMAAHPEVVLTGHKSALPETGESFPGLSGNIKASAVSAYALLMSNCFPARSVMLRREIALRFEPAKRYAEDYLLWLRIVLGGGAAWLLELPLAYSYKADYGGTGLSGNLWEMELGELDTYRRILREELISPAAWFALALFSLLKYLRRVMRVYLCRGQPR